MYFLEDEITAWCFDRAVTMFGRAVEADIDAATAKAKNSKSAQAAAQRTLAKWLDDKGKNAKGRFRDPMSIGR